MDEYLQLIRNTLEDGVYKHNRTDVDTIATFSEHYTIDLSEGYPLLTTKEMSNYRWNSMIHEFIWYLTGEHHIRNLREHTKIWDVWADEDYNLPTAYGRFWRRHPLPDASKHLDGEWWVNGPEFSELASEHYEIPEDDIESVVDRWVNDDDTFDQLQYVIDTLNGENPMRGPNSRRLVISAWHPGNADVSHLPPCHFTFAMNVQDGKLNTHLTQRSADVALGVPFNIAAYSLLTEVIAQQTGYEVGEFGHTLVDAHLYCGKGDRGEWYEDNLDEIQSRVSNAGERSTLDKVMDTIRGRSQNEAEADDYQEIREWILSETPDDSGVDDVSQHNYGYDHIPGLLEQLSRDPLDRPEIKIADKPLDELEADDIELVGYESHDSLGFSVAE